MAEVPVNEKLYAMVVMQAKAKYTTYPSPGASHWVHRRYLELGGKFEDTVEKQRREKMTALAIEARAKASHGAKEKDPRDKKKKRGDK
jgi:hypothetical protein